MSKSCKDCKYRYDIYCTRYPSSTKVCIPDSGEVYERFNLMSNTCTAMRNDYAYFLFRWRNCGHKAKHWEPK